MLSERSVSKVPAPAMGAVGFKWYVANIKSYLCVYSVKLGHGYPEQQGPKTTSHLKHRHRQHRMKSPYIPNDHQVEYNMLAPYVQSRIRVIRLRRKGVTPLGFSIRGGCEHGTGVFVSEVVNGSEAQRQGLRVGDQIIRINGFNIELAIHEEVLSLLRSKPSVVLKVKSVGMIPVKDPSPSLLTELGLLTDDTRKPTWKIHEPVTRAFSSPSLPVCKITQTTASPATDNLKISTNSFATNADIRTAETLMTTETADAPIRTDAIVNKPMQLDADVQTIATRLQSDAEGHTVKTPEQSNTVVNNDGPIATVILNDAIMDTIFNEVCTPTNTENIAESETVDVSSKQISKQGHQIKKANIANQDEMKCESDTIAKVVNDEQDNNKTLDTTNGTEITETVNLLDDSSDSTKDKTDHTETKSSLVVVNIDSCESTDQSKNQLPKLTESQAAAAYALDTALTLALDSTDGESKRKDPLTWKIVNPGMSPTNSRDGSNSYSGNSSLEDYIETKVTISAIGSSGIGCTIVKGPPDVPGIFVQTVKADGLAEQAGLQVGDQVLEMNGFSFLDIDFSEAVALLKSSKEMTLTIRQGAGLDLFPEEKIKRTSRLLNGVKHTTREEMKRLSLVREEDFIEDRSSIFTSSSSMTTNGHSTATHSRNDSLVNGILSASEKDFSLSELEESAQAETPIVMNGVHSEVMQVKTVTFEMDRPSQEEGNLKQQEERLLEEKRKLLEEQRKLREEAEKLAEERRKLEEEKKKQNNVHSSLPPSPLPRNFLSELQNFSHHRKTSSVSSTASAASEDFKSTKQNTCTSTLDKSKYQDEMVKRKQHEMLMQEFQEMHKKMFGVQNINLKKKETTEKKQTIVKEETQSNMVMLNRRQRACETIAPTPPPPPSMQRTASQPNLLDKGDCQEDKETLPNEETEQTASGIRMLTRRGSLYIPPLSTNPHMFVDPTTVKSPPIVNETRKSSIVINRPNLVNVNGESPPPSPPPAEKKIVPVAPTKPSKDLPITDSMGPAPKPPQTYFDKPAKTPLVTIGIYPDNSRQNRFIYHETEPNNANSGSISPSSGSFVNNRVQPQFNISMTSSQGSISSGSSTASSPRPERTSAGNAAAPVSFKVTYDPKTAKSVNSITVTKAPITNGQINVPKVTISVNTKKANANKDQSTPKNSTLTNGTAKNGLPEPKPLHPMLKKVPGTGEKVDPIKMFTEEQLAGREIKTFNLTKNGPLNIKVEGGINSDLGGKIIISEIWEGGLIPNTAAIQKGDQILMVDDTVLVDTSLVLANTALRNAMCSSKEKLRLLIAKVPKSS